MKQFSVNKKRTIGNGKPKFRHVVGVCESESEFDKEKRVVSVQQAHMTVTVQRGKALP